MKIIDKFWTHRGFGTGFGDLINHLSYEYKQAKEPTTIRWYLQPRTNRQIQRVVNFLKPNSFIKHEFGEYTEKEVIPYSQQDHEYWDANILHNPGNEKYCALWLYVKHYSSSPHHQDKVVSHFELQRLITKLKSKNYKVVLIPNLKNSGGETLFNIDYNFDQYSILIQTILRNCTFSICSEGGLAHLSRLMKVPTICYFDQTMAWKGHNFDLRKFWTGDLYRPCNDLMQFEQLASEICYIN